MNRKSIHQTVKAHGIEKAMKVPKGTLTPKMKRFAEQVALGETGADAYRIAYSAKGSPTTVGNHASRLKSQDRIKAEIERIEQANELAALHSATGLRSIVISTLAEIATNPDEKAATRVQAVRSIGQLVGVDAFRETKRIEHVKDSGAIRAQILDQLKSMVLNTDDAVDVDATALLDELSGERKSQEAEPHPAPTPPSAEWDSGPHIHSTPHEPPPSKKVRKSKKSAPAEPTPISSQTDTPGGDIFLGKDDVAPQ
jgi:hypothetical protein